MRDVISLAGMFPRRRVESWRMKILAKVASKAANNKVASRADRVVSRAAGSRSPASSSKNLDARAASKAAGSRSLAKAADSRISAERARSSSGSYPPGSPGDFFGQRPSVLIQPRV